MATKRTLTVEIVGDSASAEASVLKLAASLEKAEAKAAGANITWTKILGDLDKMKAAAASAAQATEKLADAGNKGQGQLMTGIENLLRGMGNNQFSSAGFNAVADGLESVGGKAILAGAGMAVAGAAAVKFGIDATRSFISTADAVRQFQAVSGASAQQASVFINAGGLMGISAENLSRAVGLMSVSMDQNKNKLADHGLATIRDAKGNADLVGTFEAVIQKIHDTTDAQERDVIAREAFGRSWQQIAQILNLTDDQLAHLIDTAKKGPILDQKNVDAGLKLKETMGGLSLEFKKFEIGMAQAFGPAVTLGIKFIEFNLEQMENAIQAVIDGLQAVARVGITLKIPGAREAYDALKDVDITARDTAAGVSTVPPAMDEVGDSALKTTSKLYSVADAFDAAKKSFTDYLAPETAGIAAADSYDAAMSSLDASMTSSAASTEDAANKIDHGASQIASAQERIAEAQQGVTDAQEAYDRAISDTAKSVADAEKKASEDIVNAERAVMDARQRAADQAVSSARAVEDAQQALLDAESTALDEANPFDAQRKREEAGKKLTRAVEDQSMQQRDSAQGILDAQAKLAQVEVDAADRRAQAQEDASRRIEDAHKAVEKAIEQVSKANEGLVTATDSAGEANTRAAQKVDSHKISQQQYDQAVQATIDATPGLILSMAMRGDSMDDINAKLKTGFDHLEDQGRSLGLNTTLADIYGTHIDSAATKVLNMNQATYDLYRNLQAIGRELKIDPGILAGEAAAAGINVDTLRPTHDMGGWLPPGVSLAVNRTGVPERVLAPGESGGSGGQVVEHHWHVGAIISDRDLADIVARAMKRGNVGFGNN